MPSDLPPALEELIDERVFEFARAAQKHYQTNDLVILLDLMEDAPALQAAPRSGIAGSEEIPALLRLKLSTPAAPPEAALGAPEHAFWFLVIYEDGDADCGMVRPDVLSAKGSAVDAGDDGVD